MSTNTVKLQVTPSLQLMYDNNYMTGGYTSPIDRIGVTSLLFEGQEELVSEVTYNISATLVRTPT